MHEIYTKRVVKVALSADDDKRIVILMADGINTMAIGHKDSGRGGDLSAGRGERSARSYACVEGVRKFGFKWFWNWVG